MQLPDGRSWYAGGHYDQHRNAAAPAAPAAPAEPRPTRSAPKPLPPQHPPTLRAKAEAAKAKAATLAEEAAAAMAAGLHGAAAAAANAAAAAKADASRAQTAASRARPSLAAALEPVPRPAGLQVERGPVPEGSRANYQVGGGVTVPKAWKGGGWRAKCEKLIEAVLAEDFETATVLAIDYRKKLSEQAADEGAASAVRPSGSAAGSSSHTA